MFFHHILLIIMMHPPLTPLYVRLDISLPFFAGEEFLPYIRRVLLAKEKKSIYTLTLFKKK